MSSDAASTKVDARTLRNRNALVPTFGKMKSQLMGSEKYLKQWACLSLL